MVNLDIDCNRCERLHRLNHLGHLGLDAHLGNRCVPALTRAPKPNGARKQVAQQKMPTIIGGHFLFDRLIQSLLIERLIANVGAIEVLV